MSEEEVKRLKMEALLEYSEALAELRKLAVYGEQLKDRYTAAAELLRGVNADGVAIKAEAFRALAELDLPMQIRLRGFSDEIAKAQDRYTKALQQKRNLGLQ